MVGELLTKWLAHYDSIHRGYTPAGIANGLTATGGYSFPRIRGGYNLYRGTGGAGSIDYSRPVGAAGREATTVSNFSWRPHAVMTTYAYAVKGIGGGGGEGAASDPARVVAFDAVGAIVGPRPNSLSALSVAAVAGGRFELRWVYPSAFEEATPSVFEVYHDNGTGTVDYNTAVGSVSFRRGKVHYEHTTGAFGHDVRRVLGVRAVTAAGVNDGNMLLATARSDASSPPVHPEVALARLSDT